MSISPLEIKEARKKNKITQEELAKKLGVSRQTVIGYERGDIIPETKKNLLISILNPAGENSANSTSKDYPTIPYYPDANASAGLNFLNQQGAAHSVPISIPNVRADAFINVFGDSMYPKFCSGEIIGIKEVDKDMVMFGHAYVIQMSDGEAYLKYIKKGTTDDNWLLVSENEHYEPREFHLKHIDKVFIIKATISRTTLL